MDPQPQSHSPQLNPLSSRVGMALAYWAYPHQDKAEASKVLKYPEPWEHAQPGKYLPADWPTPQYGADGRLVPGSPEGWNTQHNEKGKLENQFQVSINSETKEITFDFKGSDAWSNWKSDLANAGASEFAKIAPQAQAVYDHLRQQPQFQDFRFAATGHSLGGGMAQSFALHNQIDAYVYNSLPIARETIKGGYFDSQGGFEKALERYQASGRTVHDVRTPNDIATHAYEGVMQNQYLSHHTEPGAQWLPGARIPGVIKTGLLASKVGALPATYLMGKDHTMGAMADAQQALALTDEGRFRIPQGHQQLAEIPAEARRRLALLDAAPLVRADHLVPGQDPREPQRYRLERADGSVQHIEVARGGGAVEIDHRWVDGRRTVIELNTLRPSPVRITDYDAQGQRLQQDTVSWQKPFTPNPQAETIPDSARQANAQPAPEQDRPWSQRLNETQMRHFVQAHRELQGPLQAQGLGPEAMGRVCSALVVHCGRHRHPAQGQRFMLSGDGQTIGVLDQRWRVTEMPLGPALQKEMDAHLQQAERLAEQQRGVPQHTDAQRGSNLAPPWVAGKAGIAETSPAHALA
ncbi:MAG: hypothetical protein MUF44_13245 [Hydrogenophaga sp.]|nr:hypothetical protein [Hydrogenophaga sp.]